MPLSFSRGALSLDNLRLLESLHPKFPQQFQAFSKRPPCYFSSLFRSTRDPNSPYLLKGLIAPRLPVKEWGLATGLDVEASRYPLIHELSLNLRIADELFAELLEKETKLRRSVKSIEKWLKEGEGHSNDFSNAFEQEKQQIERSLREMTVLLDGMKEPLESLEYWALQDGKDKAVAREAALDMVFRLYRAQQIVTGKVPADEDKIAIKAEFIHETRAKGFQTVSASDSLSFGVAAVDINVTGPNDVNRDLGDLVIEEASEALRAHFKYSKVTKGTRTNFRVVDPSAGALSTAALLEVEKDIKARILQRLEVQKAPAPLRWTRFIKEKYQVGLSAGYSKVDFTPSDIEVEFNGEYSPKSVDAMLAKVDHAFRLAHARSQEVVGRLKQARSPQNTAVAERTNYGQIGSWELNGIPEGRFLESAEAKVRGPSPVRLVHTIQGLGNLRELRLHWAEVERFAQSPDSSSLSNVVSGIDKAIHILKGGGWDFYSAAFDASHDLRMPRLVELSFAPERVDTVIRETGGAKLLFVELGQFYSFTRSWYGGNQDVYVHRLIDAFNKVLIRRGMVLTHPANQAQLLDVDGHIAVDPKSGLFFSSLRGRSGETSGIRRLREHQTPFPVGSEVVLAMRQGDELGFVIGDKKIDGQPVIQKDIKKVVREFNRIIRDMYGHMFLDDIVKIGPDKVRMPKWQLLKWQQNKNSYGIARQNILRQEADVTEHYTGWVLDYVPVKAEDWKPVYQLDEAVRDSADVVVGRRARWRYFEEGAESAGKVFYGETLHVSDKKGRPSTAFPEELREKVPELLHQPILAKRQARLAAGNVVVKLEDGAQLGEAWSHANDLSKVSKGKGGEPIFAQVPQNGVHKPPGHTYDKSVSASRSDKIAKYFEPYTHPEVAAVGTPLSTELKKFMAEHGSEIGSLIDALSPETFEKQLQDILKDKVKSPKHLAALQREVATQLHSKGGALARARNGLAATQILQREGLSLDCKRIGTALWTVLDLAQRAMGDPKASAYLQEGKAGLVKLYVQQTGELPPEQILEETRGQLDPKSVFIPEEIFSLAKQYNVAPERVPYLVAGLEAIKLHDLGKEAFRSLSYEDLKQLADSDTGRAFLKDPKNALLLQDTLKSRATFQSVPLLTSMLMVFPAEMICGYLANKIGEQMGMSRAATEELKFGMTVYFVHFLNVSASGAWEVAINRYAANSALVGGRMFNEAIGSKVHGSILRSAEVEGQQVIRFGLKTGNSLGAVWEGMLEKWGMLEAGTFQGRLIVKQIAKGIPKVPFNMLRGMGGGYLASTIFDKTAGVWLAPDHPVRKYGSFTAFFAPDIARLALGPSRIAASPLLSRAGGLFTKAGNVLLAVAILNFGVKQLVVDNDYESWVNRRVSDEIYHENAQELDGNDWLALPFKGLRAGAHFLAPDLIDWSMSSMVNPQLRDAVLQEDLKNSREISGGIKELLPKLLTSPNYFDIADPNSYQTVDFSILSKPIVLSAEELDIQKKLAHVTGEIPKETFAAIPEDRLEKALQRLQFYQIQQGARFLVAVRQPENDWARAVFHEDGTLKAGKGEIMLDRMFPVKDKEPAVLDKLLVSRKAMVGLALLDNQKEFMGRDIWELSRAAGLVGDNKEYIFQTALYASLMLYATQAYQSRDFHSMARVHELIGKFQLDYLKAEDKDRPKYFGALQCLGVQP